MLRYKNSLLERILLEKGGSQTPFASEVDAYSVPGIDVQAELQLKGSPQLQPVRVPSTATSHASPIRRAAINRQQQSGRIPTFVPPLQPVNPMTQAAGEGVFSSSPSLRPTPPSQTSSPSTSKSPGYAMQGGVSSPTSELQAQHQQHQQRPLPPQRPNTFPPQAPLARLNPTGMTDVAVQQPLMSPAKPSVSSSMHHNYYPPSFQKHYDQLGKLSPSYFPSFLNGALFVLD